MARPHTARFERLQMSPGAPPPQRDIIVGYPVRGMSSEPGMTLEDGFVRDIQGFAIRDSVYTIQDPTEVLGAVAGGTVMAVAPFSVDAATHRLVRFTRTGVSVMSTIPGTWSALAGPALTGSATNHFAWAGWGTGMLFVNGIDGLFFIDFGAATYALVAAAPVAKYITVLGKRVILSGITSQPYRVQWSVKGSYTDWAGLGSGFEDLLGTPGGTVGEVAGVHPYADTEAWVLRQDSLWTMRETGYFDAPFQFNRRFEGVGCEAPWSATMSPVGLFFLSRHGVIQANIDSFRLVSARIQDELNGLFSRTAVADIPISQVTSCWNPRYQAYEMFPDTLSTAFVSGYCYHPRHEAWTKILVHGGVRRVSAASYVDDTIDQLISGCFYAHINHNYVTRDNQFLWGTETLWVNNAGTGTTGHSFHVVAGWVGGQSPYEGVQVNGFELLYQNINSDAFPSSGNLLGISQGRQGDNNPTSVLSSITIPLTHSGGPPTEAQTSMNTWKTFRLVHNASANSFYYDFVFNVNSGFQLHSIKIKTTPTTLLAF